MEEDTLRYHTETPLTNNVAVTNDVTISGNDP